MSQPLDLRVIEQQARRQFNQDGLLYVFLGLLMLVLGLSLANPALSLFAAFGAFLIFPAAALRRRYTYPRLGYARFEMQPGVGRGIIGFAIVAAIVLFLLALVANGRLQPYLPIAFGLVMALAFYFGVSPTGVSRLEALILSLMVISGPIVVLINDAWRQAASLQFAVLGAIIFIIGLAIFIHFVRTVPVIGDSQPAGGQ